MVISLSICWLFHPTISIENVPETKEQLKERMGSGGMGEGVMPKCIQN
jgi:hypothetical protein